MKQTLLWQLIQRLPKKSLARLVYEITHTPLPKEILYPMIYLYSWYFQVNLEEAEVPPGGFQNFSQFFSRSLKKGRRKIPDSPQTWISPCDGRVYGFGRLQRGQKIEQIKGWDYPLEDLVGGSEWNHAFQKGFFLTLYLSPRDYHRFHAPMEGTLERIRHIPGEVWPVNPLALSKVPGLFCQNERLVLEIQSPFGSYLMVCVAALNVGSIQIRYLPRLRTNLRYKKRDILLPALPLKKGEDLGCFEMGSTIILILPKTFSFDPCLAKNKFLKMGEPIGGSEE